MRYHRINYTFGGLRGILYFWRELFSTDQYFIGHSNGLGSFLPWIKELHIKKIGIILYITSTNHSILIHCSLYSYSPPPPICCVK